MATILWRGDAPPVAQINGITPANVNIGNTFTVTINGKSVTFTATAATVANVTAGLTTLLNASELPEFEEITWADATTKITGTIDTKGVPFTNTSSAAGGTATNTTAVDTTGTGPNDWSVAANWSTGSLPVDTDDVIIENSDVSILYGLGQSLIDLTSLTIKQSFSGTIGLPVVNTEGGTGTDSYYEYRATYLAIAPTTVTIGQGEGAGSGRIKLSFGTVLATVNVHNTGQPAESGLESLLLKGTHASNVLNVSKGSVGVAVLGGETATVLTMRIGYVDSVDGDAQVRCGSGVTHTTINQSGGVLETNAAVTTITKVNGTLSHFTGAVTTLTNDGGAVYYRSSSTLTTYTGSEGSTLDFSRDMRARTVTNCTLNQAAKLLDPFATVTYSNGIILARCQLIDVELNVGHNRTYTIA